MKAIIWTSVLTLIASVICLQWQTIEHVEQEQLESRVEQTPAWPPRLDEPYPDLELYDQEGRLTRLSDFRGKVILIEPIGMPCAACQAFSGGRERGGLGGVVPQPDLPSLRTLAPVYGGFDWDDPDLVKISLLLYNMDMQPPTQNDVEVWAEHFRLDRSKNEIVLAGLHAMQGPEAYRMIPGVQLVDRDFIFRLDGTKRGGPKHDLYRVLLPTTGALLQGE